VSPEVQKWDSEPLTPDLGEPDGEWLYDPSRELAWRLRAGKYHDDGRACVFPMTFARKRDAEMAIAALKQNGIECGQDIVNAGYEKCRDICINAMQW